MERKHKVIGIKELQHNLARVAQEVSRGGRFVVLKHARPAFRIEPIVHRGEKAYTLEDLYDIRFKTRDRNLSKKIDRIAYGV